MLWKTEKEIIWPRRFKISLIISLLFFILLFYLFPKFTPPRRLERSRLHLEIYVSDIPLTRQNLASRKLPPRRPEQALPVVGGETAFPEDVEIPELSGEGEKTPFVSGKPVEEPAKPLLDVYPDVSGTPCKGIVRLLLLVNYLGKIESVEVVENTTGSQKCLKLAVQAAKKSRWLPARVNHKPVNSWVPKVYKFNLK